MTKVKMVVRDAGYDLPGRKNGFTLVEIITVIVIFGIMALMAVPMWSSVASVQIHAAAKMIAMDLEYAKSLAITGPGLRRSLDSEKRSIRTLFQENKGYRVSVVFDPNEESYQIFKDYNGTLVPIEHPVKRGFDYEINFSKDGRLNKVDIVSADFDANNVVKFDCFGCPYNGDGDWLNSGAIILKAGETTKTITVGAVNGYISIE